jgi:poly(3-hydroxybutyrate) depolymerase
MLEQWTAVHGIAAKPARHERNGPVTRSFYTDGPGSVRVESVLVESLAHAFPIRTGGDFSCGQPGDFVVPTEEAGDAHDYGNDKSRPGPE